MTIKEAKGIAFGTKPAVSLDEYYRAWQWLYDNTVQLEPSDELYLDKLICDGLIKCKSN